jgi:U3 small nucleolar RNA-associated protein 4
VILSACLSPTGNLVVYSTESKINVFHLSQVKDGKAPEVKLKMLRSNINLEGPSFPFVHFLDETRVLAVSASCDLLLFIEVDEAGGKISIKREADLRKEETDDGITITTVSADGRHLAVADPNGAVFIMSLNLENFEIESTTALPSYRHQATALAFHPNKPYLLVTYLDHTVKVWNNEIKKLVYNDRVTLQSLQPIQGAKWSAKGNSVALHEIDKLYLLELDETHDAGPKKRTRRHGSGEGQDEKLQFRIKTSDKLKYVPFVEFGKNENELFTIEIKPNSLLEHLPPAFAKKRFGM